MGHSLLNIYNATVHGNEDLAVVLDTGSASLSGFLAAKCSTMLADQLVTNCVCLFCVSVCC